MMRARGLAGPLFAKHAGCAKLAKSAGNFIGSVGKEILSRNFLTFNGLNAIGIFNTPIILVGNYEITTEFSTSYTAGWQVILGRIDINLDFLAVNIDGDVRINIGGNSITSSGISVNDGLMHNIRVIKSGTTVALYIDGALSASGIVGVTQFQSIGSYNTPQSFYFNGKISYVNIKDLSSPDNSRNYIIDSQSIIYELPKGVEGDETHPQAMIYTGLLAGDWSDNWTYNAASNDCAGAGWEHDTETTICIA